MDTGFSTPKLAIRLAYSIVLALATLAPSSYGHYRRPELVGIPIGRLITNVEAKLKATPKNPELIHHLARAHAMAYAKGLGDADVVKQNARGSKESIWFGYQPPHVPYRQQGKKPAVSSAAKAHLAQAISLYDQALTLSPKQPTILRLGRAWCAKESGKTDEAKKDFRIVIKEAWVKEGKGKGSIFHNYISAEAMDYLQPLLDPKKDAAELADYAKRRKTLNSFPRAVTPIAIPLRDNLSLSDLVDQTAKVPFDLDGTGRQRSWQWLQADAAAWLVHDPSGTGRISSALQLFGSRSFNLMLEDGYAAMRLLDDDMDGKLANAELRHLALWHDQNADGVSDPGEVRSLSDYQIVTLGCKATPGTNGILTNPEGVGFADGSTRPTWDLILETR